MGCSSSKPPDEPTVGRERSETVLTLDSDAAAALAAKTKAQAEVEDAQEEKITSEKSATEAPMDVAIPDDSFAEKIITKQDELTAKKSENAPAEIEGSAGNQSPTREPSIAIDQPKELPLVDKPEEPSLAANKVAEKNENGIAQFADAAPDAVVSLESITISGEVAKVGRHYVIKSTNGAKLKGFCEGEVVILKSTSAQIGGCPLAVCKTKCLKHQSESAYLGCGYCEGQHLDQNQGTPNAGTGLFNCFPWQCDQTEKN